MNWKRYAAVAALSLVAAPAAAQTTDVDDITVDIDEAAEDLESNVPKVEMRPPIGQEEEEEGRESEANARVTVPYLYPGDLGAFDDGELSESEIEPVEPDTANQQGTRSAQPGTAAMPGAINPDAEPSINPDAAPSINPNAEASIRPDAEPFINPDAEGQVDPDALQKLDQTRSNVTALQQRIDRNFRDLRARRLAAFDANEPFGPDAYRGVGEDLTALENELTNLENAYRGVGDESQLQTLRQLRSRVGVAQQQLTAMQDARTRNSFQGAADNFGTQVGAISRGGSSLATPGTVSPRGVPNPGSNVPNPSSGVPNPQSGLPTPQSGLPNPQGGAAAPQ